MMADGQLRGVGSVVMRHAAIREGQSPGAWYQPYIEKVAGVQGGAPVLKGTRTPVRSVVVLCLHTYPNDVDEVRRALPHLSPTQIEAALAYYQDHASEIDADIERHRKALEQFVPTR
jgi:uncharacterized protein (DUF433 family)